MPGSILGSYRWSLLASALGIAVSGAAFAQTAYTNGASVTDASPAAPPPPYTLGTGDSLTNAASGSILVNGGGAPASGAVIVTGSSAAFINNAGVINFHSTGLGAAINVVSPGAIGTIVNTGTIAPNGIAGGVPDAVQVTGSVGTLLNQGLVTSDSGHGIELDSGTITGLANQGIIATSGTGASAVYNDLGVIGNLTNSGTISADGAAFAAVENYYGTIGMLANTGLIRSTGSNGAGIDTSGMLGTLSNQGVIQATGPGGNAINNYGTIADFTNSGSILAASGTAFNNDGTVSGGLTNTSSGLISGAIAIDNTTGSHLTVNNAGTIIGDVKFGLQGDTLNITGGAVNGNILGQSGTGGTVNFNTAGSFTTGGSITNVDTVSVNTGAVTLADPVTGAMLFNIRQGATVVSGTTVGAATFNNAGQLNVGSSAATINGNYNQTSTGQLSVTVNGAASGSLNVSGTATVVGHANALVINIAGNNTIFGQSYTIINAGSLVVTNPGSLTVSDNDMLVAFDVSQNGDILTVTAVHPTLAQAEADASALIFGTGVPGARGAGLSGIAYSNGLSIANALVNVTGVGIVNGDATLYNALSRLSGGQWNLLLNQLVPSFAGRAQVFLTTSMVDNGPLDELIEHRLAAGDDPAPGVNAWIKPYGGFASQDPKDGVSGYNATLYGVALGGDTAIRPDIRVGLSMQFGNIDVRYADALQGSNDSIFTALFSAYGTWQFGNAFLDGQLAYGHSGYSSVNLITPLGAQLSSSYGGNEFMGRIGAGYIWTSDALTITPQVSLQQYHFDIDSYNATGSGGLGLDEHVNSQRIDITQPRIGASAKYRVTNAAGWTAIPELHLNYMHNFGSDHLSVTGDFLATGAAFQTETPTFSKDVVDIGASVTMLRQGPWSVTTTYDHADGGSVRQDAFFLHVRTRF